jgi:hypothetical protein
VSEELRKLAIQESEVYLKEMNPSQEERYWITIYMRIIQRISYMSDENPDKDAATHEILERLQSEEKTRVREMVEHLLMIFYNTVVLPKKTKQ